MKPKQYTSIDIKNKIPHRYENLLVDECLVHDDNRCEFTTNINIDDHLGRDIFSIKYNQLFKVPTPILCEISALASIISSGTIKPGTFAYFAAITNFSSEGGAFLMGQDIKGVSKIVSEKNGFYKYSFELAANKSTASGNIMAFYDHNPKEDDIVQAEILNLPHEVINSMGNGINIPDFETKKPKMTFVDTVYSPASDSMALFSFHYQASHPLVRGHFPENPIMMGVCQWQMLEDAIYFIISQSTELNSSQVSISCDAQLFKDDHSAVCDIKKATVKCNKINNI